MNATLAAVDCSALDGQLCLCAANVHCGYCAIDLTCSAGCVDIESAGTIVGMVLAVMGPPLVYSLFMLYWMCTKGFVFGVSPAAARVLPWWRGRFCPHWRLSRRLNTAPSLASALRLLLNSVPERDLDIFESVDELKEAATGILNTRARNVSIAQTVVAVAAVVAAGVASAGLGVRAIIALIACLSVRVVQIYNSVTPHLPAMRVSFLIALGNVLSIIGAIIVLTDSSLFTADRGNCVNLGLIVALLILSIAPAVYWSGQRIHMLIPGVHMRFAIFYRHTRLTDAPESEDETIGVLDHMGGPGPAAYMISPSKSHHSTMHPRLLPESVASLHLSGEGYGALSGEAPLLPSEEGLDIDAEEDYEAGYGIDESESGRIMPSGRRALNSSSGGSGGGGRVGEGARSALASTGIGDVDALSSDDGDEGDPHGEAWLSCDRVRRCLHRQRLRRGWQWVYLLDWIPRDEFHALMWRYGVGVTDAAIDEAQDLHARVIAGLAMPSPHAGDRDTLRRSDLSALEDFGRAAHASAQRQIGDRN